MMQGVKKYGKTLQGFKTNLNINAFLDRKVHLCGVVAK